MTSEADSRSFIDQSSFRPPLDFSPPLSMNESMFLDGFVHVTNVCRHDTEIDGNRRSRRKVRR